MRQEELIAQVESRIDELASQIKKAAIQGASRVRSGKGFYDIEQEIVGICRGFAGSITGIVLTSILDDQEWENEKVDLFKGANLRRIGKRSVVVATLSGVEIVVEAEYLAPKKSKKRQGRGKKRSRRHGTGVFPALMALGIMYKCTPALVSETARQVVESCSVDEAQKSLARRGIVMSVKKAWTLSKAFATDAIAATDRLLANGPDGDGEFTGLRVVACVDGGRVRARKPRRRGPIPKGKKRRGYNTPWREPKVLIIYVIDEEGRRDKRFLPIIDGTLGDADCVIALLVGYLRLLGVDQAAQLVISGDGAKWIWNRVGDIIKGVGIDEKKVFAIVDFYHAVEHLQEVADLMTGWSKQRRKKWVTRYRKLLRRGKIDDVIAAIESLIGKRNAKKVRTELNYFDKNKMRMRYAWFKKHRLPLGSGAVESCIRRVVNLRMKGAGIFWKEENAEGFLHMRSQFKSGRWDEMVMRTLNAQAIPAAA